MEPGTDDKKGKEVIRKMLCDALRQQRHRLKVKFFNGKIVGEITTKSPVEHMTDNQWGGLLRHWADPQNVVQSVNTDCRHPTHRGCHG